MSRTVKTHPRPDAASSKQLIEWADRELHPPVQGSRIKDMVERPALAGARRPTSSVRCPDCGGKKNRDSVACRDCATRRLNARNHSGRRAVKLEDLQTLYWSTERAERELLPLVLFKGHATLGSQQALWNLAQALKAAEVETYAGAGKFVRENPEIVHAAGLHPSATDLHLSSSSIGDKLWRLGNRIASAPGMRKVDPETSDYLRFLARQSRRMVISTLAPIDRYSPWSKLAWRRPRRAGSLLEDLPELWPYFPGGVAPEVDGADVLLAVDAIVPRALPKQVREDVCQDLVLAVLQGDITAEDLKDRHRDFIKGVFKRYPVKYGALSLDAPPPWDHTGRTLAETLAAAS